MVKELVLNNRSCRGYDQKYHFTRKEMEEYIDCARLCPSSGNVQPLKYYIAYEETYVTEIQKLTHWAGSLPKEELPHKGKEPTGFVVICQDMSVNSNLNRFQKDVGIVAQTMLLLATEQGLGGCMIGDFQDEKLKNTIINTQDFRIKGSIMSLFVCSKKRLPLILKYIKIHCETLYL